MRTIGLLGGMSWESTAEYYRLINTLVQQRLGGLHSAKIVLYSVDFDEIGALQQQGEWERATTVLVEGARRLEAGGAECVLICTNTMHKMADAISAAVAIPLIHIVDVTAAEVTRAGIEKVALLGTRYTMEQEFYRGRLAMRGLEVITPNESDRTLVHRVIYEELCRGRIADISRRHYRRIIDEMAERGAQGVILGCTEIGLLIKQDDVSLPLFDTTEIHCKAAVEWSLRMP